MIAQLIGYESVSRILAPVAIHFAEAIPIACLGLAVNIASAWRAGAAIITTTLTIMVMGILSRKAANTNPMKLQPPQVSLSSPCFRTPRRDASGLAPNTARR
jgi:hypothetical protein